MSDPRDLCTIRNPTRRLSQIEFAWTSEPGLKLYKMLAIKIVGVQFERVDDLRAEKSMHIYAVLKGQSGTTLASTATAAAARVTDVAVWNEELTVPLSPDIASAMLSLVMELRSGAPSGQGAPPSGTVLASASLPWEYVSSAAVEAGTMIKPELTMTAAAQAAGGQLLGRLQYSNALSSAVRLGQLREALADASAAAAAQSTALTAAVAGQEPNLTALKSKVQPRVKGAARLVADREISQFRTQLEGRLHKARDGRDKALHKFSERHAAACAA
jgi:hypothetical protein